MKDLRQNTMDSALSTLLLVGLSMLTYQLSDMRACGHADVSEDGGGQEPQGHGHTR